MTSGSHLRSERLPDLPVELPIRYVGLLSSRVRRLVRRGLLRLAFSVSWPLPCLYIANPLSVIESNRKAAHLSSHFIRLTPAHASLTTEEW